VHITLAARTGAGADLLNQRRQVVKKLTTLAIIAGATLLAVAPVSLRWSPEKSLVLSLDRADARVGRPLTPGSVAGVHRRVERRAYRRGVYGAGAVAAGAAAGAYYYGQQYNQPSSYGWGQPSSYGWGQQWSQPSSYGWGQQWSQPAYYGRRCGC